MEPTKPFPDATFAALPHADGMAGVGPLRVPRGAVNLRPALWASGGVLALVAGAWVTWTACQDALSERGAGSTPDHRRLVALMRSERPFEPRLAGGFDHAPCTVTPHGEDRLLPGPGCGQEGLQAATLDRLRRESPGYSSTSDPHARGVWGLFWGQGEPESVAGAVADLRNAASAQPGPERWNDLAAALIVEARLAQEPALLVEALDWVTRILEQEPTYPEALYNRALLLADLGLGLEAREAWQRYLDEEIDPAWRKEAEGRLDASHEPEGAELLMERLADGDVATVAPAVARDSEAVRKLALNRLFAVWSAAVARGDLGRAVAQLDLLRLVGSELRSATGDHLVAEAVAAIDRSRQVPTLARAHDGLVEGRRLMGESRYTEAYERLEAARDRFRRAGSPLDGWAELWLAVCDSSTNRWGSTLERVAAIDARDDLARYPILDARSRWARGLIELRIGDFEASIGSFLSAARILEAGGEESLAASLTAVSAESYRALGRPQEAWRQRVIALHRLKPSASTAVHNLLLDAAIAAREEGLSHAAVALQSFGVDRSARMGSNSRWVEAMLWRSRAWSDLGRVAETRGDLRRASEVLNGVDDDGLRRRLGAHLKEAEAQHLADLDPQTAVHLLDRVLSFRDELGYRLDSASTLMDRARAKLRLGDRSGARRDLQRAVLTFERHDLQALSDLYRRDHFEKSQAAFESLIMLSLDEGDPWGALALAERARLAAVRRVSEAQRRLAGGEPSPPPEVMHGEALRQWARKQPRDVVFLSYMVLPDRVVIWRLWEGRLALWQPPVPRSQVRTWVEDLTRSLNPTYVERNFETAAARLHSLLVVEPLHGLPAGLSLQIVSDLELTRVPFHALRQVPGRYVIEDFTVARILSLKRAGRRVSATSQESVLVVGDPTVKDLDSLPGARTEARRVRNLYPIAVHLEGGDADREHVLNYLSSATLFHFSGHGLDDPGRPWASYLAVAPNIGTDSSKLLARDLLGLDLSRLQLAVLAGCSTGGGREERATPVSGLTLSLLEAGTSSVLSTLWDIEDDTVAPVLVSFHEAVIQGKPPPAAFRSAILSHLASIGTQPDRWAPLVLFEQSH